MPYRAPTIKPVVLLTIQLENVPNDADTGTMGVLLGVALGVALAFALGLEVTLKDRLGVAVALTLAENPALGEAEGVVLALTAAPMPGTPETSADTPMSGLILKAYTEIGPPAAAASADAEPLGADAFGHWKANPLPLYVAPLRTESAPGPMKGLGEGVTASMPSAKSTPHAEGVASVSTSVQPTLTAATM